MTFMMISWWLLSFALLSSASAILCWCVEHLFRITLIPWNLIWLIFFIFFWDQFSPTISKPHVKFTCFVFVSACYQISKSSKKLVCVCNKELELVSGCIRVYSVPFSFLSLFSFCAFIFGGGVLKWIWGAFWGALEMYDIKL